MTMTLVQTVTVGPSGAASIEFTGIPQTGTDLLVLISTRSSAAFVGDALLIQFNGDTTTTNYTGKRLQGDGSAATSVDEASAYPGWGAGSSATSNTFGNSSIYIPNYSVTGTKTMSADSVTENNATSAFAAIKAAKWSNTSAITSVVIKSGNSGTFNQDSTASLYLVTKGSGGASVS